MKLFDQIIFGQGGDCFRTCIAILSDAEKLEDVPNFCSVYSANTWWNETRKWCAERGFVVAEYSYPAGWKPAGEMLWIGNGPAERGLEHSVIMAGDHLYHDPHPSRKGLLKVTSATVVLYCKEEMEWYSNYKAGGFK